MFFSPVIALAIVIVAVSLARSKQLPKADLKYLLVTTLLLAVAGAVATLLMTIAWMFCTNTPQVSVQGTRR
jgi:hypothetical protein